MSATSLRLPNRLGLISLVLVALAVPLALIAPGAALLLAVPGGLLAMAALLNGRARAYPALALVVAAALIYYWWVTTQYELKLENFVAEPGYADNPLANAAAP